jgi:RteC protein
MKAYELSEWESNLQSAVNSLYQTLPIVPSTTRSENLKLDIIEQNISIAQQSLTELRELIAIHDFKNEIEEISFFKYVKPLFCCSLIYWTSVKSLILHRPVGGELIIEKYYRRKLKSLRSFFDLHTVMYEYLRGGYGYMDKLYFLRSSRHFEEATDLIDLNPRFTTGKDRLVSEIYANDLLEQYIHQMLSNPKDILQISETKRLKLKWTGSRAGIVELVYALICGGVFNDGKIGIKELADIFQDLFQIELGNYYHVFNEIRLRKKSRTTLLDHLKEQLIQKMDTMDEK